MLSIQVDAFEVQLGAGMLLQARSESEDPVTILADAGVHASGYSDDHVHKKLPIALDRFQKGNRRLDLIIGTHYDADHLKGLVPIIYDESLEIGEIWLPPVADDVAPNPVGGSLFDDQFLALKWMAKNGAEVARAYLANHMQQCKSLREAEFHQLEIAKEASGLSFSPRDRLAANRRVPESLEFGDVQNVRGYREIFSAHLEECQDLPGDEFTGCHADLVLDDSVVEGASYRTFWRRRFSIRPWSRAGSPVDAAEESLALARLRKSTAQAAITASHLAEVVEAIKRRSAPIRVRCRTIQDGKPLELRWSAVDRSFLPGAPSNSKTPKIALLGPSESLVKKHRDKLPVSDGVALLTRIPIEGITPSNELSYILRFDAERQGILITGDAGCVDFKPDPDQDYYPALISALAPLHVVQIAHHGGRNSHFYRVLLASDLPSQSSSPFLILSHATDDKHRPSEVFGMFVGELRKSIQPSLLFTSRPIQSRIEGFSDLIHPPEGSLADVGDVRLVFGKKKKKWKVEAHAVKP